MLFRTLAVIATLVLSLLSPKAEAWRLEVSGHAHVGYQLGHSHNQWVLNSPSRNLRWTPKPCSGEIWPDFEEQLEKKLKTTPLRWPSAEAMPKGTGAYKVTWKKETFWVSPASDLGRMLAGLPDEVAVTRTEEEIHCRRGVK